MSVRVETYGEFPQVKERVFGTTAEILAYTPGRGMAEGFSTNGGGQGTWVAESASWGGFTNAPGSPSSPFATTTTRNAAAPFRSNAVAWIAGDPVPTAYMLINGATGGLDADWLEMAGGSAAVAYEDLT